MARTKPWPSNSNPGQMYYDIASGGEYRYLNGDSEDDDNWLLVGGELKEHPNVSTWGTRQAGAKWYNKSLGGFFGWNGSVINLLGVVSTGIVVPGAGQIIIDRGPTVSYALTNVLSVIPNIGITVSGGGGVLRLRGVVLFADQGASPDSMTCSLSKNGADVVVCQRLVRLNADSSQCGTVELVDTAIVGDVYTLTARCTTPSASLLLPAGGCSLEAAASDSGMILTGT